jgi:uncharacterized membrane protein
VTTGYLLYVPEEDVIPLDMTVEDAAKLLISGGLVTPEHPSKLLSQSSGEKPANNVTSRSEAAE